MPMNNEERAEHAAHALDKYGISKEGRPDYDDPVDQAADLICDLMHLIRAHGGDPMAKLQTATTNFEAEEEEES